MAYLRTAMDSAYGDLNISSPTNLDGTARVVSGDPFPLDGSRASRALRIQQLSFLGALGFPLGIVPSYSPSPLKDHRSFSLQSILLKKEFSDWWVGLVGQFRPKKSTTSPASDGPNSSVFRSITKNIFDKSLYSLGLCSQISLTPSSSLLLSREGHGDREGRRTKAILYHKLPDHDITLEAASPELFIDHNGGYWNVPESVSLDCSSLVSESGLRYRFGIQKNRGHPHALNSNTDEAPFALKPGLCAKAAFSYEKKKDIWRQEPYVVSHSENKDGDQPLQLPYDLRLSVPHAAISGIIGGLCTTWLKRGEATSAGRSRLSADLFGSLCYTNQRGRFTKKYGDLTRLDAHLDICSASAFFKRSSSRTAPDSTERNTLSSPRINVIFQQQVIGPVVFRIDSKLSLDSSTGKRRWSVEDYIYSLSYSLKLLQSGKVVAWYSPKRKEGMIELRLFEF